MPTARELLEQADALMRRNRADHADDIPVLTDAVPSLAEAPMRAVAAMPAATPADLPRPGAGVAPMQSVDAAPAEGEPSDWLEIDDAEPSVIGDAPDSVAIVPPVALRRAADEELLQSAEHEEIELTPAADDRYAADPAPADLPRLPEFDERGADVAAGPAVGTGAAGETIENALTSEGAADDPRARYDDDNVVEIVAMDEFAEVAEVAEVVPVEDSEGRDAGTGEFDMPGSVPQEAAFAPAPVPQEPAFAPAPVPQEPAFAPVAVAQHPTYAQAAVPSAAALAASFAAAMPPEAMLSASLGPDTRWPATAAPVPEAPAPDSVRAGESPPTPRGPDDQAHWDSVAEEIRMQVLQRIDLFTDTGLREQLGERLKPIVDRASADLVATINQHVGELLRAYVAEAIEREIERWRQDN